MPELNQVQGTAGKTASIVVVERPNVGKSSTLNHLPSQKVAIISSKPQTTRTCIMGVLTEGGTQLVFLDMPGLYKPRTRLKNYMAESVTESVAGVDAYLLAAEAGTRISPANHELMEKSSSMGLPAILAINKIDMLKDKSPLMAQTGTFAQKFSFEAVVPVSAKDGNGMTLLKQELMKLMQPGGHFFADDALTDQPERVLATETTREKVLRLTGKEIPHSIIVAVESMKEREDGSGVTDIQAIIFCERDTHKGILIGKNGSMLKKIGIYTRGGMERFFDCKINLQLWVKVREGWRNRENLLCSLGYDPNLFQ